jgi:hypothetical protein
VGKIDWFNHQEIKEPFPFASGQAETALFLWAWLFGA